MSYNYKNKRDLEELYLEKGLTISKVAELCKCGAGTVHEWLVKFNIQRREGYRFKKGNRINLGRKKTKETLKKMSESMKGKNKGEKHGLWKGNNVSYKGLHGWVRRNKPKPKLCEICHKEKKLEISNISGEYKRDINDYKWLCRKCHMNSDGRLKSFKNGWKNRKRTKKGYFI